MNKVERINKLKEIGGVLKSEFVGLDDIIDKIIQAITPWYVTPEVIKRPVIVSLWGMTGTGKTSIIRRLTELLDLKEKSLFFDCGSEDSEKGRDIAEKIVDYIRKDRKGAQEATDTEDLVFVFDEFQYARTLDENGREVSKVNLRPVWNMMDNGLLNISEHNYEISRFCDFLVDLKAFVEDGGYDIKIKNGVVQKKEDVKKCLEALGYFYFDRGVPGTSVGACADWSYDDVALEDVGGQKDTLAPLPIIGGQLIRTALRNTDKKASDILNTISGFKMLGELVSYLEDLKRLIITPKYLNVSKSLIFIVGNLDEAFRVGGDINPDLEADIFYDETSKVTVSDIKEALKSRFRAEQIARFGNCLIKYPTLKREHFKKIIEKEVSRVCDDFKQESGITVIVSCRMKDLLYSEGVYPVQGVRPVFTTIGTILTPLLSDILIHCDSDKEVNWEAVINVEDTNYKKDSTEITILYSDGIEEKKTINLTLGKLRAPKNRKTRYINSIHEAGHAIVMTYLTGKLPTSIVSVSTDKGGFCITYDADKAGEINTKRDIANDVMIGFGGYEAEQLIFSAQPDMTLLGSGSDIENNWKTLSNAAYSTGYFKPESFVNYEVSSNDGIPFGLDSKEIEKAIKEEFERLRKKTQKILKENKKLLLQTALILGEEGDISGDYFESIIKKYGNTLNSERITKAKDLNDEKWYEQEIKRQLKGN